MQKCDKVLQSDQHMRQHIKEHTRLQNQLIMCHHCDFVTHDKVIHTNYMMDVHSNKNTELLKIANLYLPVTTGAIFNVYMVIHDFSTIKVNVITNTHM